MKIAYCVMTGDKPQHIKGCNQNLIRVGPFVDYKIVVYDNLSENNYKLLEESKPIFIKLPFEDYPNGYRNAYLNKAKELGCEYVFVTDTDELPDLALCQDLRTLINNNPHINQFRVYQKNYLLNPEKLDIGELSPYSDKFWKALIFKLEPWYQEPGAIEPITEKHPKLINYEDWNVVNLPERYFFNHTKTSDDVLFGAVRDLFLGQWVQYWDDNKLWLTFDSLVPKHYNWPSFNKYLKEGNISQELKDFIIENRDSKYTEFRSLFKYYFVLLHPEENTGFVSTYTPTKESPSESAVIKAYLDILHRHPDGGGFKNYSKQNPTYDEMVKVLKSSDEHVINEVNTQFLTYFSRVPTSLEYQAWAILYRNGIVTNLGSVFQTMLAQNTILTTRIAYCQMCHSGDFIQALSNAVKAKPYVDETILVYDQTLSIEDIQQMKNAGIVSSYNKWHDNFPDHRNYYVSLARQKGCGWMLVTDPDEHPDLHLLENLRAIIQSANSNKEHNFTILQIRPHDIWPDDDDGNILDTPNMAIPKDYWKGLLIKLTPEFRYIGVGKNANVHENSISSGERANLADEFFYEHYKSHKEIWEHACRNLFIGGGGDNAGKTNSHWVELKKITDRLNLNTWYEYRDYLKNGNIDVELKDWIIRQKDVTCHPYDSESRETWKTYFILYHPEENI